MIKKAVFTKFGEISYTPANFNCFLEEFTGDLNQKERFLLSSDDYRLTDPLPKHEVREINIPDWIPQDLQKEYCKNYKFGEVLKTIEEKIQNGKNEFFKSLKDQIILRGKLTNKQINAVLYPRWKKY